MKNTEKNYYGMFLKLLLNPAFYLIAKDNGLDFMFYDGEHGMLEYSQLHDLVLFGNNIDMPTFIRVPELSRKEIFHALDCGATGVMVPMMETKEQAQQLVDWSKYPPIGNRGYSSGANTNYGPSGGHRENMDKINEKTVTIVQIETKLGVENAEEIISVDGVDGVIVGPVDLSISLDNIGNVLHPQQIEAIEKVIKICKKYNRTFGIIGSNAILEYFAEDINYFVSCIDTNVVKDGIAKSVKDYRKITGEENE